KCPEYSVWKSDRVQLAAYAMLIEEEFETTVKRGFVEYIRTAEFRESQIRKRDKALALQILKRVKRIKGGVFPEKGENAHCDSCVFEEMCETKKTLLSKLFGK
ncbi:recombinase RecB, partial [Methanosarcinales archaeon]